MASFNKVIIIGYISNEIEIKQTTSGTSVCSFNVAVNRFSREPGEEKKADFFTVVAWGNKAEFVGKYFSKGKPILVCGRLENRSWTDKNGNNRISTEIIAEEVSFVGSASENAAAPKSEPPAYTPSAYGGNNAPQFEEIPNDGGLPF
jgi:single-strand DNA-binding protein